MGNMIQGTAMAVGMDRGGADIACYQDGSNALFCGKKCFEDPNCKAFNYVSPNGPWGAASGCCYKSQATPLVSTNGITFYTRTDFSGAKLNDQGQLVRADGSLVYPVNQNNNVNVSQNSQVQTTAQTPAPAPAPAPVASSKAVEEEDSGIGLGGILVIVFIFILLVIAAVVGFLYYRKQQLAKAKPKV